MSDEQKKLLTKALLEEQRKQILGQLEKATKDIEQLRGILDYNLALINGFNHAEDPKE